MTNVYNWSTTVGNNATADGSLWPEGQLPSTVNDSSRDNMAAIARWRQDTSGALITGGTANAQTLTLATTSLATLTDGMKFTFLVAFNNTGATTLNVNSFGAKPLTKDHGAPLIGGELSSGALYTATYIASVDQFRLHGISSAFASQQYVAKAGDTMTGDLLISKVSPTLVLDKAASTQTGYFIGRTNGVDRWQLSMGDGTAESGSNAGSDFTLNAYSDAGAYLNTPLKIFRATGALQLYSPASIQAADPALLLNKVGSGNTNTIAGSTNGVARWHIRIANSALESGGNAGSELDIVRFNDAGTPIDAPLSIGRSTGYVTMNGRLQIVDSNNRWETNGQFVITGAGWKPGGGDWADSSDARIKNVLGTYEHGLAEIKQINPVRYKFKGNYSPTGPEPEQQAAPAHKDVLGKEFIGVIAQEVEGPMPEMVSLVSGYIDGEKVEDVRALDTSALIYALVNAIKELSARLEALEAAA